MYVFFFFLIYLFLAVLGLCCCMDFSLVAESGSNSLVVVCRLLIVMASLVKHGLWNTGSRVVAHRFGCSSRIRDQHVSPTLSVGFFATEPSGKPWAYVFDIREFEMTKEFRILNYK